MTIKTLIQKTSEWNSTEDPAESKIKELDLPLRPDILGDVSPTIHQRVRTPGLGLCNFLNQNERDLQVMKRAHEIPLKRSL